MFSELAKIKTNGVTAKPALQQNSMTMAQARAQLEAEFGDYDAVNRAFKMLG